jgi:hypothetical protein
MYSEVVPEGHHTDVPLQPVQHHPNLRCPTLEQPLLDYFLVGGFAEVEMSSSTSSTAAIF